MLLVLKIGRGLARKRICHLLMRGSKRFGTFYDREAQKWKLLQELVKAAG